MSTKLKAVGDFFGKLWIGILRPVLWVSKPRLRWKAANVIIPLLQKEVDAGAVDPHIDATIERTVLEAIDLL